MATTLRNIKQAPCYPITLTEARKHLAVDASDRSNDVLIEMLIASATSDAEMKTGRVWVESQWEWELGDYTLNEAIDFPIVPVSKVEVYDMDEEVPEDGTPTDISGSVASIILPSPEPQGTPFIGSFTPIVTLPLNYKIILTAGYPIETKETVVEKFDDPILLVDKIGYSAIKIHLVFNRPVQGTAEPIHFNISQNEEVIDVESVDYIDGAVDLVFAEGVLQENATIKLSFIEGTIYDSFSNFVQPIDSMVLPIVRFTEEEDFVVPEPDETKIDSYESHTPAPVKNWILTRVGSLYSQRTEIALRAGKSNDALFPDKFINNLLSPYKVRFA